MTDAQDRPLDVLYCDSPDVIAPDRFRLWSTLVFIRVINAYVAGNNATCAAATCSGGGFAMTQSTSNPGMLTISNSTFENNLASTFGGGLYLGGAAPGLSSCSIGLFQQTVIANNTALRAGNQIYNNCGGNFTCSNSTFDMQRSGTEVNRESPHVSAHAVRITLYCF